MEKCTLAKILAFKYNTSRLIELKPAAILAPINRQISLRLPDPINTELVVFDSLTCGTRNGEVSFFGLAEPIPKAERT